jgi:hypothetical protein
MHVIGRYLSSTLGNPVDHKPGNSSHNQRGDDVNMYAAVLAQE